VSFFTEENRQKAKAIVERYPAPRSAVMPLLHLAQDQHGWVSEEAMREMHRLLEVYAAGLWGQVLNYDKR